MKIKTQLIERLTIGVPIAQREEALGWAYLNDLDIVRSGPKPIRRGGISRDTDQVIAERQAKKELACQAGGWAG